MKIGMDPAEVRRRNLIPDDAHPSGSPSGLKFEKLSHIAALDKLLGYDETTMRFAPSRRHCARQGIYRGIGLASFIEVTNPSPAFYGVGGAKISAQDGVTIKLDAQGAIIVSEQRDRAGARRGIRDCASRGQSAFGVSLEQAFASLRVTQTIHLMAAAPGPRVRPASEAKRRGRQARPCARTFARWRAAILQSAAFETLDIRNGVVVDKRNRSRADWISMKSLVSVISAPTRCRPVSRLS